MSKHKTPADGDDPTLKRIEEAIAREEEEMTAFAPRLEAHRNAADAVARRAGGEEAARNRERLDHARAQGAAALKQAALASRRGDLAAAAKWTALAEKQAHAAEKLAAFAVKPVDEDDPMEAEALRAELRMRILRFAQAARQSGPGEGAPMDPIDLEESR